MDLDPKSKAVTSFFMIAAIIVMLALAWSVASDNSEERSAPEIERPVPD